MTTLTQLEYLVAVDAKRHFANAAKTCHISQPTLSMQLKKLEDEYGLSFFDRSKQPILPNPQALDIINQARVILAEVKKLKTLGNDKSIEPAGDFQLAIIPTVAPYLIPLFVQVFARNYPKVELSIQELTTEQIIKDLETDKLDAGILATPLKLKTIAETPLYYEPFFLLVNPKHPLAKMKSINKSDLKGDDIWLMGEGHCFRNQVLELCSLKNRTGVIPSIHFESGNLETLISLVKQRGYTLLPSMAAVNIDTHSKKMIREFSKPVPTREISLVYRRREHKRLISDALIKTIKDLAPKYLPKIADKKIQIIDIK